MNCKLCSNTGLNIVSRQDSKTGSPLAIVVCKNCGFVQQRIPPGEGDLRFYYSHNYRADYKKTFAPREKHILRAASAANNRFKFLFDQGLSKPTAISPKLLDVGAGGGEVVYAAQKLGFDAIGLEPNQGYSEFARDHYGVRVETIHLDQLEEQDFDVITMFHVLEHLPNPARAIEFVYWKLRPGGYLMIEVPNIEQADASPANIFFKAHIWYFSRATLTAFASPYFDPIKVDATGNLKILFRRKDTPGQLALPDAHSVSHVLKRLSQKGWIEYLTIGGGWKRSFQRLSNILKERSVKGMQPKVILDLVLATR
jgi:2-polyprenyl-3-methyl-5-hydroxy-6-metoxy-1,4-benzoquinol methylase